MAEQEQNRSEAATPHKIKEAKKRGSVARSMEANSLIAITILLLTVYLWGWPMAQKQLRISQRMLSDAHQVNFQVSYFMTWLNASLLETLYILAPLFILLVVGGIAVNMIQTGPIFTFFPLKPDFDRINPASGFKRIFSLKVVIEASKSSLKLALFGAVLYFALKQLLPSLMQLMYMAPASYAHAILDQIASILFKLACVIAVAAAADILYTRWDYGNKLKMSRREVKEEVKHRDGDPRVRARIRELQRETLKRSKAISKVKDADVLITNPTHLAIAIKYQREKMKAPQVIAKGAGELAGLMKDIARQHRIPVVENKKLARELFRKVDFESAVPEQLYPDVARLLVWVYAMKRQGHTQGRPQ